MGISHTNRRGNVLTALTRAWLQFSVPPFRSFSQQEKPNFRISDSIERSFVSAFYHHADKVVSLVKSVGSCGIRLGAQVSGCAFNHSGKLITTLYIQFIGVYGR